MKLETVGKNPTAIFIDFQLSVVMYKVKVGGDVGLKRKKREKTKKLQKLPKVVLATRT